MFFLISFQQSPLKWSLSTLHLSCDPLSNFQSHISSCLLHTRVPTPDTGPLSFCHPRSESQSWISFLAFSFLPSVRDPVPSLNLCNVPWMFPSSLFQSPHQHPRLGLLTFLLALPALCLFLFHFPLHVIASWNLLKDNSACTVRDSFLVCRSKDKLF